MKWPKYVERYAPDDADESEAVRDYKALGPIEREMFLFKLDEEGFMRWLYGGDGEGLLDGAEASYETMLEAVYAYFFDSVKMFRAAGIGWNDLKKLMGYARIALFRYELAHHGGYAREREGREAGRGEGAAGQSFAEHEAERKERVRRYEERVSARWAKEAGEAARAAEEGEYYDRREPDEGISEDCEDYGEEGFAV